MLSPNDYVTLTIIDPNLNFHTIFFVVVVVVATVVEIVCLFDVFVVVSGVLQFYARKNNFTI